MATLAQQLKAAREAKGVSESDAGAATKILTKMIVAMEADNFSVMAAPTYAKGFIRLYAEYLGLRPDPLVAEYVEKYATPRKPLVDEESQLEQNFSKSAGILGKLPKLGATVRFFSNGWKKLPEKDFRRLALGGAGLLVVVVLIMSAANCVRRLAAAKPAQKTAEAPARTLLSGPLPDLVLVEPGKIESPR